MPEVMTIVFLLFIIIAFYAWMGVVSLSFYLSNWDYAVPDIALITIALL